MSAAKSLLTTPSAGFDEPFAMLEACHERIVRMLDLLDRLRAHVRQHGCDGQARQAARDVMRYFDQAGPHHHRDEELHVFPPLLAGGDAAVQETVRRLQEDHREMEARWGQAREVLARVAEAKVQKLEDGDEAQLADFAALYANHLQAEEQVAYPAAQSLLGGDARSAMGAEMARRRGAL